MYRITFIFVIALTLHSCNNTPTLPIKLIPLQLKKSAETPNFYLSPQGNLFLSWVQQDTSSASLVFSKLEQGSWTKPKQIASGNNWVVNWADFSSMTTFPSSELSILGQYLEVKDTTDPYHYGIKLALSRDGGDRFRIIDSLHDQIPAEHGFVSLIPYSFDRVLAIWLDGSAQASSMKNHSHNAEPEGLESEGGTQLRSAMIDFDGNIKDRVVIDNRVCDCCQTDACMTPKGPIVVYRDRSKDEIRDIYYTRYLEGQWTEPKPIYKDHWKINACPVNGPAVASLGNKVAVTWYTEQKVSGSSEGKINPKIQLVYSMDAGNTFSNPIEIKSQFTQGRLDIIWVDEDQIAISFLDKGTADSDKSVIKLALYSIHDTAYRSMEIDTVSPKRKTGFPILEKCNGHLYMAYTIVRNENNPTIKTIQIN